MSSHLPHRSQVVLEPRKWPVQPRSAASVQAILPATIQVLLKAAKTATGHNKGGIVVRFHFISDVLSIG